MQNFGPPIRKLGPLEAPVSTCHPKAPMEDRNAGPSHVGQPRPILLGEQQSPTGQRQEPLTTVADVVQPFSLGRISGGEEGRHEPRWLRASAVTGMGSCVATFWVFTL